VASGISNASQIVGTYLTIVDFSARNHGFIASLTTCRDQVQVDEFSAKTDKRMTTDITGNTLRLDTADNQHGIPGLDFIARVTIKDGSIPINQIHMRYVQNMLSSDLTYDYNPNPDVRKVLLPGASFPLLDMDGESDPPPPFYLGKDWDEINRDGPIRSVLVSDSPWLTAEITSQATGTPRQLQGVNSSSMFRMFLGCYSGTDSTTFQTVATLDWSVAFTGTFDSKQKKFKVGKNAGISAAIVYSLSKQNPVLSGPTANKALTFVDY
jgi:hypothetical protein